MDDADAWRARQVLEIESLSAIYAEECWTRGVITHTIHIWYIYGQVLTFARRCNATSFGMVQMYCK